MFVCNDICLTGKMCNVFVQALDHVIAEARKHDVRLLLCLVNNLQAYGGKSQYVQWAWQEGVGLSSSNDSFFFDPSIRKYFKNYLTVLTFFSFFFFCKSSPLADMVET